MSDQNGLPDNFKDEMQEYLRMGTEATKSYSEANLKQLEQAIANIQNVYSRADEQMGQEAQAAADQFKKQMEVSETEEQTRKLQETIQLVTQLTGVVTTLSSAVNS